MAGRGASTARVKTFLSRSSKYYPSIRSIVLVSLVRLVPYQIQNITVLSFNALSYQ